MFATHRLQQVFTAAAAHGLNNQVRLSIGRDGEYGRLRRGAMNAFSRQCGAPAVAIEVNNADIGSRRAQPVVC
ncbi:MAG: hypothetical protein DMG95_09250 [Acidobacteria bacterium]|nr:MAG: hypothetical protein DMG95_09250 [Acidobacteriota bacterium]